MVLDSSKIPQRQNSYVGFTCPQCKITLFQQNVLTTFMSFREQQSRKLAENKDLKLGDVISLNLTHIEVLFFHELLDLNMNVGRRTSKCGSCGALRK